MSFVLNSASVDEVDRADFVHEALGMTVVPIDLHWPEHRGSVSAQGVVTDFGDLTICSGRTSAWKVERTATRARDSTEPSVFVNVRHAGTGMVVQHGREVTAGPGELVMYDTTAPYTLLDEQGVTGDFFRIPHSALALPHDQIRAACAVSLGPSHPITTLTRDHLRRLAADPSLPTASNADLVGHPSIELIRAVILTHLKADGVAEPLETTLHLRILDYARAHLHEVDLSPDQIASAHYISVRKLYKVLSANGIGLSDWIRTRRLEACRQALSSASQVTTIGEIARRSGFSDMSSFSRSFRAAYGLTPREWRDRETKPRQDS